MAILKKVYKANGVPIISRLVLTNISAYIHLFIMSIILYIAAPLAFNAEIPENPKLYLPALLFSLRYPLALPVLLAWQ